MKLSIQNYNLLNFNNDNIVISQQGVSRINSPSLLEVIRKLNNRKSITDNELICLFNEHHLDQGDAYLSLEKILGLQKDKENTYFEKAIVAHDWDDHALLESLLKSELPNSTIVCKTSELPQKIIDSKPNFFIFLCRNYDYNELREFYFRFISNSPESSISICYSTGEQYIIGQPYFPALGNPCHFCTIDRLINHETYKPSKNTWSSLLNFCRSKNIPTPSEQHTLYQKTLIIGAVIQKIKLMIGTSGTHRFQDNILQETTLSLSDGRVSESSISHWCMCDCLRTSI